MVSYYIIKRSLTDICLLYTSNEHIIKMLDGGKLWLSLYSKQLFGDYENIEVNQEFVDDDYGIMFNNRRVSKDSVLNEHIIKMLDGHIIDAFFFL